MGAFFRLERPDQRSGNSIVPRTKGEHQSFRSENTGLWNPGFVLTDNLRVFMHFDF